MTGATGHLGQEVSFGLAQRGAQVLVNGRSEAQCDALVQDIKARGGQASCAVFDITDEWAVQEFATARSGDPLHVLVNNAYAGGGGNIDTAGSEEFRLAFDIGLIGPHNLFRALLPQLRKASVDTGDASVVNIASMYGLVSPDLRNYASAEASNPPYYGAAKAALMQYTRYAACEFGPVGIRVNAVAPGPFPAPPVQRNMPDFIDKLAERVPLGRIGQATEIGGPVAFLASPAASYVNGAILPVDGGWTCW